MYYTGVPVSVGIVVVDWGDVVGADGAAVVGAGVGAGVVETGVEGVGFGVGTGVVVVVGAVYLLLQYF